MNGFRAAVATIALVGSAAIGAACGDGERDIPTPTPIRPGPLPANLTTITVTDFRFQPLSLQVPTGTRVTWTFRGNTQHSVVGIFNGAGIDSGRMRSGNFEFVFTDPGTFSYRCGVHGNSMSGTVVVR